MCMSGYFLTGQLAKILENLPDHRLSFANVSFILTNNNKRAVHKYCQHFGKVAN